LQFAVLIIAASRVPVSGGPRAPPPASVFQRTYETADLRYKDSVDGIASLRSFIRTDATVLRTECIFPELLVLT
jgi:hypothetical protein